MEEDDSLLDANTDDVIIRETQERDSPRSFSKSLISHLGLCQTAEAETASIQTNYYLYPNLLYNMMIHYASIIISYISLVHFSCLSIKTKSGHQSVIL